MHFALKTLANFMRRFRRNEDGSPTLEFVLLFMPFMILPVSGVELGLLMTRHVMLERGIDMAVREVRLNTNRTVTEHELKRMICNVAGVLPNCMTTVRLELQPFNLRVPNGANPIPREASCTDLSKPFELPRNFVAGQINEMMIVRACGKFVPLLPEFGLGYFLSRMDEGYYRLVSTSAFVMEPI